ncbi:MAG: hypothetical protein Q9216_006423 [Gyalolechia sp. 2 TL-2023]
MSLTFALQSLLARHEAYVLEAEEERRRMATAIGKLECDKRDSEATNARIIEDNRNLLDQLESLNNAVSDSEAHVLSLNATLQSTRQELDRLNALAARTSHLESQLSLMEAEQTTLHEKLASSEDGQRSAIQRWKDAERTIGLLQEQIDRIETEAKDESERHAEVMNRYERRQAVERQLESAAGRLKGAAAATTLERGNDGNTNVVSHFVKDILADNASLQMGIMELREMLLGSNQEVQNLRDQMILHQELPSEQKQSIPRVTLEKDLDRGHIPEQDNIPALHVHHHYHEPNTVDQPGRQRSTGPRRQRRRRNLVASGVSTPKSSYTTPRSPRTPRNGMQTQTPSSAATILSQTSASIPPSSQAPYPHRLSIQSTTTRPSMAPSLESTSPHPSMFDFLSESSRPTSPDSIDVFSPAFIPLRSENDKSPSLHNSSSPTITPSQSSGHTNRLDIQDNHFDNYGTPSRGNYTGHSTIFEEPEHDPDPPRTADLDITKDSIYSPTPNLRRPASHESILSTSGLPSNNKLRRQQSLLFRGSAHKSRTSFSPSSPTTSTVSSQPVISATPITAAAPSSSLRSAKPTARAASSSGAISTLTSSLGGQARDTGTLGQRVGGWVWGKWGVVPMASTGNLRARAKGMSEDRPAGVNQKGSLRALRESEREKRGRGDGGRVEPVDVDEGLLRESLGEG